jgi:ABC-type branched-subunit amino acid transport system substrate-binding protein
MQRLKLLFLGLIVTFSFAHAQGQSVFRIGVLDDQRGAMTNGARLAVQEINDAGGVRSADGTFVRLELVIPPLGSSLQQAVDAVRSAAVVAVLGPETNEEVLNGMPQLQSLGVPVLTTAAGDSVLTSDNSGRLMRTRAAEVIQGQALANFLVNEFGMRRIATVQLDVVSTASVIGFSTSASALGVTPQPALLLRQTQDVATFVERLTQADPEVIATYGSPALAGTLYRDLRAAGWQGIFAYNLADDPTFRSVVPFEQLTGILSSTTWSFTAMDSASVTFLNAFIRSFGALPGAIEASSYDGVKLLAAGLGQPGDLLTALQQSDNVRGVQGILRPAQLSGGEISNNVAVTRLGSFGAPEVLARYEGSARLPADQPAPPPNVTPTPAPTATLEGVFITITSERQNVRSGPGLQYDILGQLNQGEQQRVIGTSIDYTWVIIDFRGQQGWLATYLLDVFGDLNTLPIIAPPPTPTPGVTPTATLAPEPDIVIDAAGVLPSPIVPGQPFTVSVTVRNAGNTNAGTFAIAATFPPNNVYIPALIPSLNAGQSVVITLAGSLTSTGYYTTAITADINNQVPEGSNGELNNTFNFSYLVDHPVRNQGSQTLNLGDTIDLEGNFVQGDANWNADGGLALDAIFGAKLGVIAGSDITAVHWDLINPAVINRDSSPRAEINLGTLLGIITADGNRGVLRVDSVTDTQLTVTFKVYQG